MKGQPFLIAWGIAALTLLGAGCNLGSGLETVDDSSTTSAASTTSPETTTTAPPVTLPPPERSETAIVIAVIDGDTFIANIDGVEVDVRMLGMNAPEVDECAGDDARTALTRLLAGFEVALAAGEEDVDDNGRALRYVYVEGGEGTTFVNRELVAGGFAVGMQNGHEHEAEFKELEARAWASGTGMWGTFVCGQPEGGYPDRPQVRVLSVSPNPEGPDTEALNEESVEIVNEGYGTVAVSGWVIRDESSSNRFTIPSGISLNPGNVLTIVTGCGTDGGGTVHWCSDTPVWSNGGDTVVLLDTRGNAVARLAYGPTES